MDDVTRDIGARAGLDKAVVAARESLWKRRCNHRVVVRRTLQRWQTARTAQYTEIVNDKLSRAGLADKTIDRIVGMMRRYTTSPHLTRHVGIGADVSDACLDESSEVHDHEVDDIVSSCLYFCSLNPQLRRIHLKRTLTMLLVCN